MCLPAIPLIAIAAAEAMAAGVAAAGTAVASASTATLLSAASLAVGVGGAGASYLNAQQQSKMQNKAMVDNYGQQMGVLQTQYEQTNKQTTDEMSVRAHDAMVERARLRVIGGESGLAGGSNDRILNESSFNEGTDIASLESSRQNSLKELQNQGKALRAGSINNISQIQRPSLIGTGLQIAGAAADAATTHAYLDGKLKTAKGFPNK